jgi:hypothetical protein
MAIVPNLNNVPISSVTPLSDPHNASKWEKTYLNNGTVVDGSLTAIAGNQKILNADPNRRMVSIYSADGNDLMAVGVIPLSGTGVAGAVPLYGGGGYEFNQVTACNDIYLFGVVGQKVTVWTVSD